MKIAVLPLDSRPCTSLFAPQLCKLAGAEVFTPPREILGFFKQPSDQAKIIAWLEGIAPHADVLVVCIEQLLYGGLIQSRTNERGEESCLRILDVLRKIKMRHPQLRILANNILMRTTISVVDEQSAKWWALVSKFSHLSYLLSVSVDSERERIKTELHTIQDQIPEHVLSQFFAARQRNHHVNMRCIELVKEEVLDQLLILQEDSDKEGIQWIEQQAIHSTIEQSGLEEKVFLHNGTDEAAIEQALLATYLPSRRQIQVQWLSSNVGFTARYEDRPFLQNLHGHLRAMQMDSAEDANDCLFILPPKSVQGDYCPQPVCFDGYTQAEYRAMADAVAAAYHAGKHCYLLDLSYANGGDLDFMMALCDRMPLIALYGYAAWNTASNSLGTILGQIVAAHGANLPKNQVFTAERILDDLVYQGLIRSSLEKILRSEGIDVWNLIDMDRANELLAQEFDKALPVLERLFDGQVPPFLAKLDWPRTFEVEIFLQKV